MKHLLRKSKGFGLGNLPSNTLLSPVAVAAPEIGEAAQAQAAIAQTTHLRQALHLQSSLAVEVR
jgi:hypothetical protein